MIMTAVSEDGDLPGLTRDMLCLEEGREQHLLIIPDTVIQHNVTDHLCSLTNEQYALFFLDMQESIDLIELLTQVSIIYTLNNCLNTLATVKGQLKS